MLIQINSGKGPKECELACALYLNELMNEYDLTIIECKYSDSKCIQSVVLYSEDDLSFLEGTVQWICESPYRKHHKRKNWFIDVSVLKEKKEIENIKDVQFEIFHSSGKGGQNVNKVATAVRAIHLPTDIRVVCMDERTQALNKKKAYEKLVLKLNQMNKEKNHQIQYSNWNQHNLIVRGNPYRIYEGMNFKRIK